MEVIYQDEDSALKYSKDFESYIIKVGNQVHHIPEDFVLSLKNRKGLVDAIKKAL